MMLFTLLLPVLAGRFLLAMERFEARLCGPCDPDASNRQGSGRQNEGRGTWAHR
jgi:hypothetical protein